jgi:hypothetical protein
MARSRDYDDDEPLEDDFEEDRPRRRRSGGDGQLSGMDGFMNNMAVMIIFAIIGVCCCPLLSIILGGIGMATCKNPDSKRNSMIVLVAGLVGAVLGIISYFAGLTAQLQNR